MQGTTAAAIPAFKEGVNPSRTIGRGLSKPLDKRFPYMPGIDAMRALAVLAVFGYHAGIGWTPGGFLGVDVFFVISGYLITSLLLREFQRGGHIALGRFWLRRAQRLLPAVAVLVAGSVLVPPVFQPARVGAPRGGAGAPPLLFPHLHLRFRP